MYMVRVGVRVRVWVWVRFRVCHDMFWAQSSMSTTTWKLEEIHKSFNLPIILGIDRRSSRFSAEITRDRSA